MRLAQAQTSRRRSVGPSVTGRLLRMLFALLCAALSFGLLTAGAAALKAGWPEIAATWTRTQVFAATAAGGLVLQHLEVAGRQETPRAAVFSALDASYGTPILAIDLGAAKARLEAEGWVKHATIERRLPDTLLVTIEERIPAAVWQKDGQFALIDRAGAVIARSGLDRFQKLPQLVGADAPKHAGELLDALKAAPELGEKLDAAVRVGARRWSLHFAGGIEVKLPDDDVAGAVERLARMQRRGGLFARDIRVVDLRIPDRFVVRPVPRNGTPTPTTGRL